MTVLFSVVLMAAILGCWGVYSLNDFHIPTL
jgi:hypothetical protein